MPAVIHPQKKSKHEHILGTVNIFYANPDPSRQARVSLSRPLHTLYIIQRTILSGL